MPGPIFLHVAFEKREIINGIHHPRHWQLVLAPEGAEHGTYYHVKVSGAGNKRITYERVIETNRPLAGFEMNEGVAAFPATHWTRIHELIQSVPPQRCQSYVVAVLVRLEQENYIPWGTVARKYMDKIEARTIYERAKRDPLTKHTLNGFEAFANSNLGGLKMRGARRCCY
ncbi:hypothetical protein BJX76DRAFT_362813 [Aspergillus varians]